MPRQHLTLTPAERALLGGWHNRIKRAERQMALRPGHPGFARLAAHVAVQHATRLAEVAQRHGVHGRKTLVFDVVSQQLMVDDPT